MGVDCQGGKSFLDIRLNSGHCSVINVAKFLRASHAA